jgi:hypothetical protein
MRADPGGQLDVSQAYHFGETSGVSDGVGELHPDEFINLSKAGVQIKHNGF